MISFQKDGDQVLEKDIWGCKFHKRWEEIYVSKGAGKELAIPSFLKKMQLGKGASNQEETGLKLSQAEGDFKTGLATL